MTDRKDIQSLINDIDGILPQAGSRLPWSKPGDATRERQVLERVRSYLVSQQQNLANASESPLATMTPAQAEVAQQIGQAVTQEMNVLRANLMQPLQLDLEALHQQRESLVQEIRHLERTRQEMEALTQQKAAQQKFISEFSQELISRCTVSLTQQLAQIMGDLEARLVSNQATTEAINSATTNGGSRERVMLPQERLEQLRQLQLQSDRLLTTIDANQRVIFEALQRNLQSYEESLSQGLEKMHNLGVQGELLFTGLINRLAQQLGRETSTLLHTPSLPSSDSTTEIDLATSHTRPETLLPSDAITITGQSSFPTAPTLQGNPLVEPPMPLQADLVPTQEEGERSAADPQEAIPNETTSLQPESQSLAEDYFSENLSSEDWEIVEGLDSENADIDLDESDRLDTFLQLDIDTEASLPLDEVSETPDQSASVDLDSLLRLMNERSTTVTPEVPTSEVLNQMAELNAISDRRRQEIDELYKTLFGTDSLINTAKPDESEVSSLTPLDVSEPQSAPSSQFVEYERLSNTESVNPLSSQVEELLYEGLVDPSAETTQGQELTGLEEQLGSWDLFDDSGTGSLVETAFAGEALSSSLGTNSLSNTEQETVKTISSLNDLLEEMGLSYAAPAAKAEMPTTIKQPSPEPTPDPEPEISLVEDNYIPASPEEDLLITDEVESDPDVEIWLDRNTLEQLSEDLHSFEGSQGRNFRRQDEPIQSGNYDESPLIAPDPASVNQQYQQFLLSDELLAEDWEEFAFNNLSERSPNQNEAAEQNNSTLAASESIESDFDPDLFPTDALELDPESAIKANAQRSDALGIPEEVIALEDGTVIDEMQWDEPTDSATEEAIASPKFDSDSVSQLNPELEEEEAVSQQPSLQENSTETLASATSNDLSDREALSEEAQRLEQGNVDIDLHQPEAFNPEQPDNEKKKESNSESEG